MTTTDAAIKSKRERNRKAEAELKEIQRATRQRDAEAGAAKTADLLDAEYEATKAAIAHAKELNKAAAPTPAPAKTDNKPAGKPATGTGEDK